MALPTPSPLGSVQLPNGGFEDGPEGWLFDAPAARVNLPVIDGAWCAQASGVGALNDGSVTSTGIYPVVPGQSITLTNSCRITAGTYGTSAELHLLWINSAGDVVSASSSGQALYGQVGDAVTALSVTGSAPTGAVRVAAQGSMNISVDSTTSTIAHDSFSWNYNFPVACTVTSPAGSGYTEDSQLPLRITITGTTAITSVRYFLMTHDGIDYENPTLLATVTSSPWAANVAPIAEGSYAIYALVTLTNGVVLTSNSSLFTVGPGAPPATREYNASNAYAYLVGSNFSGLSSAIPSTALVTGVEVIVGYNITVLTKSLDIGLGPELAHADVAFDCVSDGVVEVALMSSDGSSYTVLGTEATESIPLKREDFTITEEAVTVSGHKWIVMGLNDETSVTLGDEAFLFGINPIAAAEFITHSIALRFYPTVTTKPSYAASGNAVFRFFINSLKLRVFFDAGSVEYYFASPDKTQAIKGRLVSAEVLDGDFRTGDAEGVLQLTSDLEVIDGTQTWIGNDWTIHSAYPPTDSNQIGLVGDIVGEDELGMEYNGLPTQQQILDNRSRYVFLTANFYGDRTLDSIYGVHGLPRAFAYNGDFFYKIFTQPDPLDDNPRHIAYHHGHLALGFNEGRVDISVVGSPYNFDGALGASSWALGDGVIGLLPLSGTILGAFCYKSIWGISGTTVDNFATQVLSPNMGAIEYTICDMGAPVYANAYGIYTLSQTQEYGDYLGNPMSQDVSPWLRPRLVRKYTSDKEVVVAWPVRSKNQYRLAFSDGYVLSMTMNGQTVPTFSTQKYFYQPDPTNPYVSDDLYSYPSIVPAAISSQLDDAGQERIHIAPIHIAPIVEFPSA